MHWRASGPTRSCVRGRDYRSVRGPLDRQSPTVGYVNLYYLAPEWGRGLASALDHYMCDVFNGRGWHVVRQYEPDQCARD